MARRLIPAVKHKYAIKEYKPFTKQLQELYDEYNAVVYDIKTPKGMKDAKAARAAVREFRYAIQKTKDEVLVPYQQTVKDAQAKVRAVRDEVEILLEPVHLLESAVHDPIKELEDEKIRLSGIFSNGTNIIAQINTKSEHTQYFKTSDTQITAVLTHEDLKWEIISEQSAQKKSDLDAAQLHEDLALLLKLYQKEPPAQLPTGTYSIVFGPAATAHMVHFLNWIGFNGGLMKRGYSFMSEENPGKKVFSEKVNLLDDPERRESFPFQRDFTGIKRTRYPLFEKGIFKGFVWSQDDADEFEAEPTGHTVSHKSLVLEGGTRKIHTLQELIDMPRDKDILYIPFLHYMNIVNPTKGVVTASSRFGALLLKKDGSVGIPFNVRMTQSLLDVFGDKVAWLSKAMVVYNISTSYGARNPTSVIIPRFIQVDDLEISHSNPSF